MTKKKLRFKDRTLFKNQDLTLERLDDNLVGERIQLIFDSKKYIIDCFSRDGMFLNQDKYKKVRGYVLLMRPKRTNKRPISK